MSAATRASAGMTIYSAAPPSRSVNRARSDSRELMDNGAAILVGSPPPCGEGLGVGVGVSARAASTNDCSHSDSYPHEAMEQTVRAASGRVKQLLPPPPTRPRRKWGPARVAWEGAILD